jgi:hypothetical protein
VTVTWTDTPGQALGSRNAPVRFTVSDEVSFVGASFEGRSEEIAYRDDTFVYPYAGSEKHGGEFTLRRSGGWPSEPTVRVEEIAPPPGPPTGAQSYGTIYTLDFAAQPSQSLNAAPGAVVIDGLTWWAKNPIGDCNIQLQNGSGLSWVNDYGGAPSTRAMCLPLANVPGFNPLSPLQVWFNMQLVPGSSNATVCGLGDVPSDASALTSDHLPSMYGLAPNWNAGNNNYYYIRKNNGNTSPSGPDHGPTGETAMIGVVVANTMLDYGMIELGYAGGSLPPIDPFQYTSMWYQTWRSQARVNPAIILQGEYISRCVLRKLSIIQPKVAA